MVEKQKKKIYIYNVRKIKIQKNVLMARERYIRYIKLLRVEVVGWRMGSPTAGCNLHQNLSE